jgi:tetratricopeptide (TPR) repeat protein
MPSVEMGPLHLVDHLIRVHPEQQTPAAHSTQKSQFEPISAYLRIIVANTDEAAEKARQRVLSGESFYKVALESSVDPSASIGGYQGRKPLPPDLSLTYGEMSEVFQNAGHWEIVQRLPRDFRWQAEQLQHEAERLATQGDPAAAIQKSQEALKIYPHFLRALNFIGITYAQNGNAQKGASVLTLAARLYPDDGATKFSLASVLEDLGDTKAAIHEYQQAIALEKDFVAAYVRLGILFESTNDRARAIKTFSDGLQIDPLSADLNYNLGLTLTRNGELESAKGPAALTRRLSAPHSR